MKVLEIIYKISTTEKKPLKTEKTGDIIYKAKT